MNSTLNPSNKEKIAIVAVGYNRINSLRRLLNSLQNAHYDECDIPLYISIDASGNQELYDYVNDFRWDFGEKFVNIQQERLGLKRHIYQCGDLTKYFKAVVLLEDDLYVSPYYYKYVKESVERYGSDSRIAEISLYRNEYNGYVGLPLTHQQTGCDVYLMQDVSTWGQIWTEKMWSGFKQWLDDHNEDYYQQVDMPEIIKGWKKAWSKYYNAYVVDTRKYVLYPSVSLTTNFSDAGVHGGTNNSVVQVNLLDGPKSFRMDDVDKLVKYDIYYNNESIYEWLKLSKDEVCLDLYGFHNRTQGEKYILSTLKLPFEIVDQFALNLRPLELNIKYKIKGKGLYLYDTNHHRSTLGKGNRYDPLFIEYCLQGFRHKYLIGATVRYYFKRIIEIVRR